MKKTTQITHHRAADYRMPHIGGISATERRHYWPGSPWSAFRMTARDGKRT